MANCVAIVDEKAEIVVHEDDHGIHLALVRRRKCWEEELKGQLEVEEQIGQAPPLEAGEIENDAQDDKGCADIAGYRSYLLHYIFTKMERQALVRYFCMLISCVILAILTRLFIRKPNCLSLQPIWDFEQSVADMNDPCARLKDP